MKKIITFFGIAALVLVSCYFLKGLIMTTNKPVLLIIAKKDYQPTEYGHTRKELEDASFNVSVASDGPTGSYATPSAGTAKTLIDVTITDINPNNYNGMFIIGGPGAMECLDNQITKNLMQTFAATNKPCGAICISPRILATASLLNGKKATGWDDDNKLEAIFKQHNVTYVHEPVVVDKNVITANGPKAATAFGKAIVEVLKTA